MPQIYLIRHGEPSASTPDADPRLSARGQEQAGAVARLFAPLQPMQIISSPLLRAWETAAPLAAMWNISARKEEAIGEIPLHGLALIDRSARLRALMQERWEDQDDRLLLWRQRALGYVKNIQAHAVIFSHFVLINAVVGSALGRDEIRVFKPAHASVTLIDNGQRELQIVKLGEESDAAAH
jgi:broad specificity phosphatase PhoE